MDGSGKIASKAVGNSDGTAGCVGLGEPFLIIKRSTGRENEEAQVT